MFITNEEQLLKSGISFFSCEKEFAIQLMTFNKIPILFINKENKKYYFKKNKKLEDALDEMGVAYEQ